METCLAANPDINVVYTINEPAAQGGYDALSAAGKSEGVIIVSVDGGCDPGLRLVDEGVIGATPSSTRADGDARDGGHQGPRRRWGRTEVSEGLDFFNTGVAFVTDSPVDGVDSISVQEGKDICWGGSVPD